MSRYKGSSQKLRWKGSPSFLLVLHPLSASSRQDDSDGSDELTLPGSDSSEDSDSDNDDTASLASSIAELSSGEL